MDDLFIIICDTGAPSVTTNCQMRECKVMNADVSLERQFEERLKKKSLNR